MTIVARTQPYRRTKTLSRKQIERFEDLGYVLVPNVLTAQQVQALRARLTELFDHGSRYADENRVARHDVACRYREFRWILSHPPIVSALASLLGDDFVYIHEMSAHDSFFGGWHKDTTSQERAGHNFHWETDYKMVQCALYLQDNGEYGGGLDVNPGSHVRPDRATEAERHPLRYKLKRKLQRAGLLKNDCDDTVSISSHAGDLVVFDFRLSHHATPPKPTPIPPEHRKLAIFIVASRNNEHVQRYMRFIRSREDYGYLKDHDYPDDFLAFAREHRLNLAR